MKKNFFLQLFLLFLLSTSIHAQPIAKSSLNDAFLNPPNQSKLHTWWHWVDGAITKEGITKDLESMKKQGVAQATILNVSLFGGKDFGVEKVEFNSPQWYDMFTWALQEAKRLDIILGAHNCDGWSSSGGPWITLENSMKQFVWSKTMIKGGGKTSIKLSTPYAINNFYKDVAVIAYKTNASSNSFQKAKPSVTLNDTLEASHLYDGSPLSATSLKRKDNVIIKFTDAYTTNKIVLHTRRPFMWKDMASFDSKFTLYASTDGKDFKKIKDVVVAGLNKTIVATLPETTARVYKLELSDYSYSDPWYEFSLGEVELIKTNESPSYAPSIPYHLEKIVSVKPQQRQYFNITDTTRSNGTIDASSVIEITDKMLGDGTLNWQVPEGNWSIIRFGYTTTAAINAPATAEGTGYECDKMDSKALDIHFNSFSKKLIDAAGDHAGSTFKFILVDSWECGYQNWTQKLPETFKAFHGYNLNQWIPVLCGETVGSAELSEGFLYDFRKTIGNMIEENYYKHFRDLCHQQNVEFHSEVMYGDANYPPLDILKCNSYVDMPMFEFWAGNNDKSLPEYTPTEKPEVSFPTFASVVYDKPIIGAEAYTATAHFSESPQALKPFGDRAYCAGMNQFILHSYVHQPVDKKPGMTLGGFASHFNRNNPWWINAEGWLQYHARIQMLLQQGERIAEVLYYVGDQLPQYLENNVIKNLPKGYTAIACNFDALLNRVEVKDGKLLLNDKQVFHMLVLPDNGVMELPTLQRIEELVRNGAIVYGQKPSRMLSLKGIKAKHEFYALTDKIWGNGETTGRSEINYGKGKIFNSSITISQVLKQLNIAPQFYTNDSDSLRFMYLLKRVGNKDVFFVTNQKHASATREFLFRTEGKQVEILNPLNGTISKPAIYAIEKDRVRLPVTFKPYETLFFIFSNEADQHYIDKVTVDNKQIFPRTNTSDTTLQVPDVSISGKDFIATAGHSGEYLFTSNANKQYKIKLSAPVVKEIKDLKGTISFSPVNKEQVKTIPISDLRSYTDFTEPDIKYFSGSAHYVINFFLDKNFIVKGDSMVLSIGNVESIATIKLNGKLLGNAWQDDQQFNLDNAKAGNNILEIEITNAARNRIIGDLIQYGALNNVWTSSSLEYVLDKDKPLKPSGVIGPLKLVNFIRRSISSK